MNMTAAHRMLKLAVRPAAYARLIRDGVGRHHPVRDDDVHLHAAVAWLLRAEQQTGHAGVSAWYCLGEGWHGAYPETTGYIIPTCLDYVSLFGAVHVREAALRMGAWTLTQQHADGGVAGGTTPHAPPVVFNTGQCMLGWARLLETTGDPRYREALRKGGEWLTQRQDPDGKWSRFVYRDRPHAYHSRVAWPLLRASVLLDEPRFREAATRHVQWCLGLVGDRGWLREMAFFPGEPVLTHTLAYTYRGLFECARFLDGGLRDRVTAVVAEAAENLLHLYERRKVTPYGRPRPLPGTLAEGWVPTAGYSCVTGNAQIALLWLALYRQSGDLRRVNAAFKLLDDVKRCQDLRTRLPGVHGGVPSSSPIWGGYLPMRYLNWAAKFFADALMARMAVLDELERRPS